MAMTLQEMKTMNKARETEEKRTSDRRRAGLVLSIRFLQDNGYTAAARAAEEQTGISLSKVDVADNINMVTILQEYEEYVHFKFGRQVKLIRKVSGGGGGGVEGGGGADGLLPNIAAATGASRRGGGSRDRSSRGRSSGSRRTPREESDGRAASDAGRPPRGDRAGKPPAQDERPVTPPPALGLGSGFDVHVRKIGHKPDDAAVGDAGHDPDQYYEDRLLKVIPSTPQPKGNPVLVDVLVRC